MDHLLSKDIQDRQVLNIPGLSHTLTYLLFSFERLVSLQKAPASGAFFLPWRGLVVVPEASLRSGAWRGLVVPEASLLSGAWRGLVVPEASLLSGPGREVGIKQDRTV